MLRLLVCVLLLSIAGCLETEPTDLVYVPVGDTILVFDAIKKVYFVEHVAPDYSSWNSTTLTVDRDAAVRANSLDVDDKWHILDANIQRNVSEYLGPMIERGQALEFCATDEIPVTIRFEARVNGALERTRLSDQILPRCPAN